MTRFALKLEYDGRAFVGWQRQVNGVSVQQVLEQAAARLSGGPVIPSVAAGRTDAGVHAAGQVVLVDLPDRLHINAVRNGLNFHMQPHAVAVLAASVVSDPAWSPRFSAIERSYRYVILNRPARPALGAGFVWHVRHPLDVVAMQEAADVLVGRHDFTSFRALACQAASPVRTVDRLAISRLKDRVVIDVSARSFLHHQVRNFVGTLKLVGTGHWSPARVAQVLAACDRAVAGPTAPSGGLTLMHVRYPEDPFADQ
ncbi:tRNA pseudouridine(38-40) synthase TruA [Acidiphilium sp. PA]|uniref:tRNA pseudouridine(38-40) synthase TruA n=1 Tax=Acidiphilium sp. PA TaxID=2871705 RepID=UPI0022446EA7|nr:tRNA pseudouridine(38-40) synthase TruA [Acidiphilium sp. PA]MCW8308328.1 tRNA pseudouridine(38-40) synthase TruA [Acidiphilium sp. PA]